MQRVRLWVWVRDLRRWILVNGTVEYTSLRAGEFSGWLQTLCWTRCLNLAFLMGGWGKRAQGGLAGWRKAEQPDYWTDVFVYKLPYQFLS